jgi:hypothetical protein
MQKRRKTSLLLPVSCYSNGNGWNWKTKYWTERLLARFKSRFDFHYH